jgi:hypothetical protein
MKTPPAFLFGVGASCLVGIAVIAGLMVMGSPAAIRAQRLDAERVSALQSLSEAVHSYYALKKELPASIDAFRQSNLNIYMSSPKDPATGEMYEYATTGAQAYRLCATFQTIANDDDRTRGPMPINIFQHHLAGHQCFNLTVKISP